MEKVSAEIVSIFFLAFPVSMLNLFKTDVIPVKTGIQYLKITKKINTYTTP